MVLFRNAYVYENGIINQRDILFDGVSISSGHGDVSTHGSLSVFPVR